MSLSLPCVTTYKIKIEKQGKSLLPAVKDFDFGAISPGPILAAEAGLDSWKNTNLISL